MGSLVYARTAPTFGDVALDWVLDPASLVLLGVSAALYVLGVRRVKRPWPRRRTVAFAAGWLVLLVATHSGLGRYDTESVTVHAGQHALLGLVAPLLLVLGAPVTLALTATTRPTRSVLLRWLHSPPVRLVTHPLVVWLVFGGTLVAIYGTPLLDLTNRNALVHTVVHLHVIVTGVLFCEVAVGTDALPRPLPHWARLVFVLFAIPFHAVVGLALVTGDEAAAGGILWATGELFALVTAGIVLARWMAAEERAGRRFDAIRARAVVE